MPLTTRKKRAKARQCYEKAKAKGIELERDGGKKPCGNKEARNEVMGITDSCSNKVVGSEVEGMKLIEGRKASQHKYYNTHSTKLKVYRDSTRDSKKKYNECYNGTHRDEGKNLNRRYSETHGDEKKMYNSIY